jgi:Ni,Fe-hydrogenase I large subunit
VTHVVIDPVTRIEGHLRVEAEIERGVVRDAWASGTMFRGIELILRGRDPREAWLYTQRICSVCTMVHALASVRAIEDALGIQPPPIAVISRNLIAAFQYLHDHVVTFFHLRAIADWMDVTAIAQADPEAAAEMAQRLSDWPGNSPARFRAVQEKLQAFIASGQLGPLANGYWGHPGYTLTPEVNLMLAAHYLEALDWQRDVVKAHAILGGKNPVLQTFLVGGTALPADLDSAAALNADKLAALREIATRAKAFVDHVYLADHFAVSTEYEDWRGIGERTGNFLSYGDFPLDPSGDRSSFAFPGGVITDRDPASLRPVDPTLITEEATRAWYEGGDAASPYDEDTVPAYTGPKPPYERLDTAGAYTWVKAPRYDGLPMEVGPLARVLVAYASGEPRVRTLTDGLLDRAGLRFDDMYSTLGRRIARWVETAYLADLIFVWLDQLTEALGSGDTRIHAGSWDPADWPAEARGAGFHEAPRGALGHWVRIRDGKIANYQCVVPTTWNASPRDAGGVPGPLESSLVGTPVVDPARPLEILRVLHTFDPCMACAIHCVDMRGTPLAAAVGVE